MSDPVQQVRARATARWYRGGVCEPASWNESTCRITPRHLETGIGWIQSSFFVFLRGLIRYLIDIWFGLGYGIDIPLFLYFLVYCSGATHVLTPQAAPSNLSNLHLSLERCHRFFLIC